MRQHDDVDYLYELMLITRMRIALDVERLPKAEQHFVRQHIAELDGYLTLHAPTHTRH